MKLLVSLAFVAATIIAATPSVAVDATISPLCRGETAKKHANFCAAVANNKSMGSESSGPDACDPYSPLYTVPCED